MPRPRGESWDYDEVALAIDEIIAAADDDHLSDPENALERARRGDFSDGECEDLVRRAQEALHGMAAMIEVEDHGAVITAPREATERMRVRRDADAETWRRVLAVLQRP